MWRRRFDADKSSRSQTSAIGFGAHVDVDHGGVCSVVRVHHGIRRPHNFRLRRSRWSRDHPGYDRRTAGLQNGEFRLEVTGTAEIPIVVEAGTDMLVRDWVEVYSGTLTDGSLEFTDRDWTEYQARFYRVRSPNR